MKVSLTLIWCLFSLCVGMCAAVWSLLYFMAANPVIGLYVYQLWTGGN